MSDPIKEAIKQGALEPRNQLDRLQQAILARLVEKMPGRITHIAAFDEEAQKFDFQGLQGALFVKYEGSSFTGDDTSPMRIYAPARVLTWSIYVLVRSLKGAQDGFIGANEVLEEVRRALQGQSFCGATPCKVLSDRLDAQIEGGWRFVMQFSNSCPAPAYMDERVRAHAV
ncbi:Gp37 family protein [Candidatus Tokpelaia sp.]|uniref:Gp37 family protein n=1 Tax=Candidatus Tokpelaia sp. TaxID=2233777 RepID=UPI00123C5838|nr:Gp37 family protein [Candidatus Tokpelaia sp.]KAA6404488.1 hypothetical protein DPQ22_09660 [Candidatus Tokpelaia sp.]